MHTPTQHKLIQLSGVSFCMPRDVLNISGGSFKKICIFQYNEGGASKTYIALTFDLFNGS